MISLVSGGYPRRCARVCAGIADGKVDKTNPSNKTRQPNRRIIRQVEHSPGHRSSYADPKSAITLATFRGVRRITQGPSASLGMTVIEHAQAGDSRFLGRRRSRYEMPIFL